MENKFINEIGERVDRLVTLDIPSRNIISLLYTPARKKSNGPLCMEAAKLLKERVQKGDVVFITTGWPDRPHITPEIAETDGPPGASALARALHRGRGAVPIILIEDQLVSGMKAVAEAMGLRAVTPEQAIASASYHAALHTVSIIGFPTNNAAAENKARDLIRQFKPSAVIAIEKGGMNEKGKIHTSRGADTSEWMAKADYLVIEAQKAHIATIGIGDGGNELGMGTICSELRESGLPFATTCNCGCGGGIVPVTPVDVLVTACISNWGAYGIAACLAALQDDNDIVHDSYFEGETLHAAARMSFIDGVTGYVMPPGADGLPFTVHQAFITLLRQTVAEGIRFMKKGSLI